MASRSAARTPAASWGPRPAAAPGVFDPRRFDRLFHARRLRAPRWWWWWWGGLVAQRQHRRRVVSLDEAVAVLLQRREGQPGDVRQPVDHDLVNRVLADVGRRPSDVVAVRRFAELPVFRAVEQPEVVRVEAGRQSDRRKAIPDSCDRASARNEIRTFVAPAGGLSAPTSTRADAGDADTHTPAAATTLTSANLLARPPSSTTTSCPSSPSRTGVLWCPIRRAVFGGSRLKANGTPAESVLFRRRLRPAAVGNRIHPRVAVRWQVVPRFVGDRSGHVDQPR